MTEATNDSLSPLLKTKMLKNQHMLWLIQQEMIFYCAIECECVHGYFF